MGGKYIALVNCKFEYYILSGEGEVGALSGDGIGEDVETGCTRFVPSKETE